MATQKQLEDELQRLRAEVSELRSEKERMARWRTRVAGFATGAAARILFGRQLVGSLQAWLRGLRRAIGEKTVDDQVLDETGDVLAAVVRRVIRVGVLGAVIAVGPAVVTLGVLLWQNFLIRQQVNQQASDSLIARRAQLLAIIYEEDCGDATGIPVRRPEAPDNPEGDSETDGTKDTFAKLKEQVCRPKAPVRARQEAGLAFVMIERGRGVQPDLSGANLSGAHLRAVDLHEVILRGSDLSWSRLSYANLSGADLSGVDLAGDSLIHFVDADDSILGGERLTLWYTPLPATLLPDRTKLRGALLQSANLSGANLASADLSKAVLPQANLVRARLLQADLSEAILIGADLSEAFLHGANFSGADLTLAKNLTQGQIDFAQGDAETKLPPDLKRPAHWIKEE